MTTLLAVLALGAWLYLAIGAVYAVSIYFADCAMGYPRPWRAYVPLVLTWPAYRPS